NFINQEIVAGEDVELGYLNPPLVGGGHFVEVVCSGHVLGVPFIVHRSDQLQTNVDLADALGTTGAQFAFLVDSAGDGRVNMVGDPNTPNVELVIAESPVNGIPALTSWGEMLLVLGLASAAMAVMIRKRRSDRARRAT